MSLLFINPRFAQRLLVPNSRVLYHRESEIGCWIFHVLCLCCSSIPDLVSVYLSRIPGDGKSFEFGHNGQLGGDGGIRSVHESCSQSVSSVQQQHALREIGNDNSSHCPSFPVSFTLQQKQQSSAAPPGNDWGKAIRFTCQQQQSSIASLPAILTQQQSSISPPGTDWDEVASFTQPQSSVAPPGTDWGEPVWFTCQQQSSISKLASFTQQQQSSIASLLGVDQNKPAILTQ